MTWFAGLEHIIREGEPLAPSTWLRLGGPAEFFAEPTNVEELSQLLQRCHAENRTVRVLGGGSNVLVPDDGVQGVVIQLSAPAFCEIKVEGSRVAASSGAKLGHLISTAVREGLGGLESLVGIPGTVGGAIKNNSDSHGTAIGAWVQQVTLMQRDGTTVTKSRPELQFGYRSSNIDELILSAELELQPSDATKLTRQMQKRWIIRRAALPTGERGTARAFKDQSELTAAAVLEQAGLKGNKVGGAVVCDRNLNYIEADQGATSTDVVKLLELMQQKAEEQTGIKLEQELQVW